MNTWPSSGTDGNRRRSQRVIFSLPVNVSGETAAGAFDERTQTLVINAHGALIVLTTKISQGQELKIRTAGNPEQQTCRVVYVGPTTDGKTQFGIEFVKPAPNFWHITFPAEGWTPVPPEDVPVKVKIAK